MSLINNIILTHDHKNHQLAVVAAYDTAIALCQKDKDSDDKTLLWLCNEYSDLGYIDLKTGDVSVVGNMGVVMTDIAFDSKGNLYGITLDYLYKIDKATAKPSLIGRHNNGKDEKNSLMFGPDDTLYAAWDAYYTTDPNTGRKALVGNGGKLYKSVADLSLNSDHLFLSSNTRKKDKLIQIDINNGKAIDREGLGLVAVYGLSSRSKGVYGGASSVKQTLDNQTGRTTSIGDVALMGCETHLRSVKFSDTKEAS